MDFFVCLVRFGFVGVIEVYEECLILLKRRIYYIEDKGQGHKRKHVYFVVLAVFIDIFEEVLLVRQLLVVFEVVQTMLKNAVGYAALVFVVLT